VGDACELEGLLQRAAPPEWLAGTAKIVMCVGNTIGIMPAAVQDKVRWVMVVIAPTSSRTRAVTTHTQHACLHPQPINPKQQVYEQMAAVAGDDGANGDFPCAVRVV
jgi:hypothetical protein